MLHASRLNLYQETKRGDKDKVNNKLSTTENTQNDQCSCWFVKTELIAEHLLKILQVLILCSKTNTILNKPAYKSASAVHCRGGIM